MAESEPAGPEAIVRVPAEMTFLEKEEEMPSSLDASRVVSR